jgi:two-component system, NtrC family, response regulator PilR
MNKKYKVVVVDDEETLRNFLSDALAEMGFEVLVLEDAKKALKEVKWQDYDIAIIDFLLPGMKGTDLIKEIRPQCPKLEIIMLTAYEQQLRSMITAYRLENLNIYDIVSKPILYAPLERLLHDVVKKIETKKAA